jgi:hypothetical protein
VAWVRAPPEALVGTVAGVGDAGGVAGGVVVAGELGELGELDEPGELDELDVLGGAFATTVESGGAVLPAGGTAAGGSAEGVPPGLGGGVGGVPPEAAAVFAATVAPLKCATPMSARIEAMVTAAAPAPVWFDVATALRCASRAWRLYVRPTRRISLAKLIGPPLR